MSKGSKAFKASKASKVCIVGAGPVGLLLAACVLKDTRYDVEVHEARKRFMTREQALGLAPDVLQHLAAQFPSLASALLGIACGSNVPTDKPIIPKCVVCKLMPLFKYITAPVHTIQRVFLKYCKRVGGRRFRLVVPASVDAKQVAAWEADPRVRFVVAASGGREGAVHARITQLRPRARSRMQASDVLADRSRGLRTYGAAAVVGFTKKVVSRNDRATVARAAAMKTTTPQQRQFVTRDNKLYLGQLLNEKTHRTLQGLLRKAREGESKRHEQRALREALLRVFGAQLLLLGVNPDTQLTRVTSVSTFDVSMVYHDIFTATKGQTTFLLIGDAAFTAHFFSGQGVNSGMRSVAWFMRAFMQGRPDSGSYERALRKELNRRLRYARSVLHVKALSR